MKVKFKTAHRHWRLWTALLVTAAFGIAYALSAGASTVIPVPNPIVMVTTHSGGFTRTMPVPIGGAPIPMNVTGPTLTGLIQPDIDVSVGLVSLPELGNGKLVVPNVVVKRDPLAITLHRPAPNLDLDATIQLQDAADGLKTFATIHYGFATPPGTTMPPVVTAALVGPLSGGFIDPLQAKLDTPGYSGPLNYHVNVTTASLNDNFELDFDATPESIFVQELPSADGVDALYRHTAPVADVDLNAHATLTDLASGEVQDIEANVERLPQQLTVSEHAAGGQTKIAYDSSSVLSNPDVHGIYRDSTADGGVTSADVRIASLPPHLRGEIDTTGPEKDIAGVHFAATDANGVRNGDAIASVGFSARNYVGDPGPLPGVEESPSQFVAAASKRVDATHTDFRASGLIYDVRSLDYVRSGANNDAIDARADVGGGTLPLHAVLDLDNRGPGAPADARSTRLDTTITPLPRQIHAIFDPSDGGNDPTHIRYESSAQTNVTASAIIAGATGDACGDDGVTCLDASVQKVPATLDAIIPGPTGQDIALSDDSPPTSSPDVTATVDRTDTAGVRMWADVGLLRIPHEVRARLGVSDTGAVTDAEFHACDWDYSQLACHTPAASSDALGRVTFTVRDQPSRSGLPERPDTGKNFVTLISRDPTLPKNGDEHFEAAGRVDEVRNVAFQSNGLKPGTLGAAVDVGTPNTPFDIAVDEAGRAAQPGHPKVDIGATALHLTTHVTALPHDFTACFRDAAKPRPQPADAPPGSLLAPCERTDVLGRTGDELDTTPMSLHYKASSSMAVRAKLTSEGPDVDDLDASDDPIEHTTVLDTGIDDVPAEIRADVIPGTRRKIEVGYSAHDADGDPAPIPEVDINDFESRRSSDVCGDPRPDRSATCLTATVHHVPADIYASFDPDPKRGDIVFESSPPADHQRMDIDPIHVDMVSADSQAPLILDGSIDGMTPTLTGRFARANLHDGTNKIELAELSLDACHDPGGHDHCYSDPDYGQGIKHVKLTATNSVIGQGIPDPPDAPPGVTDEVSFTGRRDHFKVVGDVHDVRDVLYSRFEPGTTDALQSMRVGAGVGADDPGTKLRAYVDMQDAANSTLADAIIKQPPRDFTACLRAPMEPGGQDSSVWCEKQDPALRAIQLKTDPPPSGRQPDVDIDTLRLTNSTNTTTLTGDLHIANLGGEIDVLANRQPREDGAGADSCTDGVDNDQNGQADAADSGCRAAGPDVQITGKRNDGHAGDIAGRVTVDLQNYDNKNPADIGPPPGAHVFPWVPLDSTTVDPADNPANHDAGDATDPGGTNLIKAIAAPTGDFYLHASIPHVQRVGFSTGMPCHEDAQTPALAAFDANEAPVYSCIQLGAARHVPLGIAVRTLDGEGHAIALEEGHFNEVPSGDDGLQGTLAAMPPDATVKRLCGKGDDGQPVPPPCVPPLLSVENDRATGQSADDTALQAAIAQGFYSDLAILRAAKPYDDASRRLNYDEPPSQWAAHDEPKGIRIKLGTAAGRTAMRIGMDFALPRFLDIYPPSSWQCQSMSKTASDDAECHASGVSTDENKGYESMDLAVKVVGAENHHDGTGFGTLGRVSLFIEPLDFLGQQMVITGAQAPDDKNGYRHDDQDVFAKGASSVTPETLLDIPANDPSIYGARLPGHLDVRLFMRNDYNASEDFTSFGIGDNPNQQWFTQVDGRTNSPTSLAIRLENKLEPTRSGHMVPGVQLSALNLPGADGEDFGKPSFRVRSELRPSFQGGNFFGDSHALSQIFGLIDFLKTLADVRVSPYYFVPVLPDEAEVGWIDIKLNADPGSDGTTTTPDAAHSVDSIAGPFGALNQADLRGWKDVNGSGSDGTNDGLNKGASARITPQANLRVTNFKFGGEGGISALGVASAGFQLADKLDIQMGVTGADTERMRLDQVLSSAGIVAGPHGETRIDTKAFSQVSMRLVIDLLWGLIPIHFPPIDLPLGGADLRQPIDLHDCNTDHFLQGFPDHFSTADLGGVDRNDIAMAAGFPDWAGIMGLSDLQVAIAGTVTNAVTSLLSPFSCLLHAFYNAQDNSVDDVSPAPRYEPQGRHVPDADPHDGGGIQAASDPGVVPQPAGAQDITVSDDRTMCGTITANHFTVTPTGTVRVGKEGEHNPGFIPALGEGPGNEATCTGSLRIGANYVDIQNPSGIDVAAHLNDPTPGFGRVLADGVRTDATLPDGRLIVEKGGGDGGLRGDVGQGAYPGGGIADPDPNVSPDQDFGTPPCITPYGGSALSCSGAGGGGAVVIAATENAVVDGLISASGEKGAGPEDPPPDNCLGAAGGGGGAGSVTIDALRVGGDGLIRAHGGAGGDGNESGGGGAGGHITLRSITGQLPTTNVDGGKAGQALGNCENASGDDGDDGDDDLGETFKRAAFVQLDPANRGPIQKSDQVKLDLRMIQDREAQGNVEYAGIVLCRTDAPPEVAGGLNSGTLDPVASGDPSASIEGASGGCQMVPFDHPTESPYKPGVAADEYRRTVTVTAPNGWHGWFAIASALPSSDCAQPGIQNIQCQFGQNLAEKSTARIGVDRSAPYITHGPPFDETAGSPGCPDSTQCINTPHAVLDAPFTDPMSGLAGTQCRVNGGPWTDSCQDSPKHTVNLGDGDGIKNVDVRATDALGNLSDPNPYHGPGDLLFSAPVAGHFFLDTHAPETPAVTLTYSDQGTNGWHHVTPQVSVSSADSNPSSGYSSDPIRVFIDGGDQTCGQMADGSAAVNGQTVISCDGQGLSLPTDGSHKFNAQVTDRSGNVSDMSDTKRMKVDNAPPKSALSLTPAAPDGNGGWYKTAPLYAFITDDNPGGSGVDTTIEPSGVRRRIDDGPWRDWTPQAGDTNVPDGTHTVCFYAIDVAGNKESDVEGNGPVTDPPHCSSPMRVDTQPPTAKDGLSPPNPDGANSYYVHKPTVAPSGTDGGSGLDRVEMQIDGGDWQAASHISIAEGTHEVRVRSFDHAGNESAVTDRIIRVDLSPPVATTATYPPAPNDQGWFRETPTMYSATLDGSQSSGPDGATYTVDGGAPVSYLTPFTIDDAEHDITVRPRDRAGLVGVPASTHARVDRTAPTAAPSSTAPGPILLGGLLGHGTSFTFTTGDALTPRVKVRVVVLDELENVVRVLDAGGPYPGGYRDPGTTTIPWDGHNAAGKGVLPGLYHFRVQVADQAGNTMESTESPPFLVVLGVLPL